MGSHAIGGFEKAGRARTAGGRYRSPDELIEQAVRQFLNDRQRDQRRLGALRRIGQAVDQAGLYERVPIPGQE
jgi:Arc/MetJ-type ribon-helix-helix transcriptional regulator